MTRYVLVAYASKYGSTQEIAEWIGSALSETGLSVDVMPADEVNDAGAYEAVVLGSAVYAGQWRKDAVNFLEKHEFRLRERPVWLFSSGPVGEGDPVTLMKGWTFPENLREIANRIKPRDITLFHGEMDISKLNLIERLLVKGIKAPAGDFRDWDIITDWAHEIAESVAVPAAVP